jgi:hypothetical protein
LRTNPDHKDYYPRSYCNDLAGLNNLLYSLAVLEFENNEVVGKVVNKKCAVG